MSVPAVAQALALWIEPAQQADTCVTVPDGVLCYYSGAYEFTVPDSARITEVFNLAPAGLYDVYRNGSLITSAPADSSGALYLVTFKAGSIRVERRAGR